MTCLQLNTPVDSPSPVRYGDDGANVCSVEDAIGIVTVLVHCEKSPPLNEVVRFPCCTDSRFKVSGFRSRERVLANKLAVK